MTTRAEPPWATWAGERRGGASSAPAIRVSDAERGEVADALSQHYADGRLDQMEFDERLEKAMKAKTRADFGPLLADLPRAGAPEPEVPARRPRRSRALALLAVVLVVVLAASTASALLHPHAPWIVIGIVLLVLARHRHHGHGRQMWDGRR